MPTKIVSEKISLDELRELAKERFGDLVKAVVDIDRNIMAVDGEFHADQEQLLLENGSKQYNLWGINIFPDRNDDGFIQFDSMINIRPLINNRTRGVEDKSIREKIVKIVKSLVRK